MSGQTACTPCETCRSAAYSDLFGELDELTKTVNDKTLPFVVEKIGQLAKESSLECHRTAFSFKFDQPNLRDRYWKALKVKSRNPESVVDTILKSDVVKEHPFGITRQVFLKADSTQTPRREDVFIDEARQSVLFVVRPPEGCSVATNRIVEIDGKLHYQGVYFYLRHRDPAKEDLIGTHQRVFENIKNRVTDRTMDRLYAKYYEKVPAQISSKKIMALVPFAIAAMAIAYRIFNK